MDQPLRPLSATPSTMRRWKIRNKISSGRDPRIEDAWMSDTRCHFEVPSQPVEELLEDKDGDDGRDLGEDHGQ